MEKSEAQEEFEQGYEPPISEEEADFLNEGMEQLEADEQEARDKEAEEAIASLNEDSEEPYDDSPDEYYEESPEEDYAKTEMEAIVNNNK